MTQFTRSGRRVAGWAVVATLAFSGYLWVANMAEPDRTYWFLYAGFGIALCVALEARAQVRELRKRIELLERLRP